MHFQKFICQEQYSLCIFINFHAKTIIHKFLQLLMLENYHSSCNFTHFHGEDFRLCIFTPKTIVYAISHIFIFKDYIVHAFRTKDYHVYPFSHIFMSKTILQKAIHAFSQFLMLKSIVHVLLQIYMPKIIFFTF